MPKTAFHLHEPNVLTSRVVFASPHSGRDYPWSFLQHTVLDEHTIRSSEDAYIDRLYDCAPLFGAPLLRAGAPRAFVDLNRSPSELDPALINGVLRHGHNPRVASGLGVVPRVVANGREIYRGKLPMTEVQHRIDNYWRPYHSQLQGMLDQARQTFGESILIDCHSMPHEAVANTARKGAACPEVVIGDRFGASAHSDVVDQVEAAFVDAGLTVVRNTPFAGAYVTQHYGRPVRKQHAVQIEVDRSLYMDESLIRPNAKFAEFRKIIRAVVADLASIGRDDQAMAAE